MYQVSLLCNKCLNEDFRSREGLMGPLSGVVILKILYRFGDEDLVIWTATSASMNRSTASEILEWIINPLCANAFNDILFENIKFHYKKKQIFKYWLWNTALYLVSAVSADGLGHPHAPHWPEGIGTLGANTHLKKMQLHRQHDCQTDRRD